ncbi:MAG: helix-turn-helix transcriptional regulator [Bdellovibrio sp.]|nr:helix-turn-helix transcriptional regulator [Bdellovibrio sp.]
MSSKRLRLEFGKVLKHRRKERGHSSAYSFFYKNGGKKKLGFSYPFYLMIERGQRTPSIPVLRTILDTLGLLGTGFEQERNDLLHLFLKCLDNGGILFDSLFTKDQTTQVISGDNELLLTTARNALTKVPLMSLAQATVLSSNPVSFWIFQWLLQTGKQASLSEMEKIIRVDESDLNFAMKSLIEHRLVIKKKNGTFACPFFDTDLFAPPSSVTHEKILWSSEQIQKRLSFEGEDLYYGNYFMAVENQETLAAITSLFRDALRKSYLFRPIHPVSRGTLVSIEARIGSVFQVK